MYVRSEAVTRRWRSGTAGAAGGLYVLAGRDAGRGGAGSAVDDLCHRAALRFVARFWSGLLLVIVAVLPAAVARTGDRRINAQRRRLPLLVHVALMLALAARRGGWDRASPAVNGMHRRPRDTRQLPPCLRSLRGSGPLTSGSLGGLHCCISGMEVGSDGHCRSSTLVDRLLQLSASYVNGVFAKHFV